jgi:hypothetical protein
MIILKVLTPLLSFAIGIYFQWQANRIRNQRWQAENSYKLGRMYRQIDRYDNIAKVVYIIGLFLTVIVCLF